MSSAKLTRISTYNLLGDDKVVKLKKWSQAKFYTLIKVIGEILEIISITYLLWVRLVARQ